MAAANIKGIPLSKVSPAFLHANSTSHTSVFSAFAELIDNAYDPDVSASELLIDMIEISDVPCLVFLDNGAGMDRDHLLKMLSFGFCEKDVYEKLGSHQPIGHYGNGFKSGSMRIGKDALVFTRSYKSASIGFLSQTYLAAIQTDSVVVPILDYRLPNLDRVKSQESRNNLNAILEYSVFNNEHELKEELRALEGSKTGTKVIISNLKRLQDGNLELDFSSDPSDIRCPEAHEADMTSVYHRPIQHSTSEYKRSLREYCSILFLRPRMKITIRGNRVKSKLISKSLYNTEIDMYKPTWLPRPVKIIFGFICEERPEDYDYGMMLYHRNRLIKAYEKVGYQRQPNGLGVGVVGVAQVDFLQPIHNKQDFNKDEKFNSVMSAFGLKLNDYWNEKKGTGDASPEQQTVRTLPDWLWVQCDHCLKWRRLPDVISRDSLPDLWYCRLNADATHNRCDIPEEPEDEDLAVKPTYEKTYKRKQEERKRLQQIEKEREEEIQRRKILEKEKELKEKEAKLRAIQDVAAVQPVPETKAVKSLQKALADIVRKEEQHKRLILQMQEQKKQMMEQRDSLLQMAESLQTRGKKNRKVVLEQMSKLINNISSVTSSESAAKRKSSDSASVLDTPSGKKLCLKTETGEELAITQNNSDSDQDQDMVSQTKPSSPVPEEDTDEPKSAGKEPASSVDKDTLKIAIEKNGKKTAQALLQIIGAAKENARSSASALRRSKRRQQQDETVSGVIDLTDDSEQFEEVDVKPNVARLEQDIEADIKPDKSVLDEALSKKDSTKKQKTAVSPLKEAKKEIECSAEEPPKAVEQEAEIDTNVHSEAMEVEPVGLSDAGQSEPTLDNETEGHLSELAAGEDDDNDDIHQDQEGPSDNQDVPLEDFKSGVDEDNEQSQNTEHAHKVDSTADSHNDVEGGNSTTDHHNDVEVGDSTADHNNDVKGESSENVNIINSEAPMETELVINNNLQAVEERQDGSRELSSPDGNQSSHEESLVNLSDASQCKEIRDTDKMINIDGETLINRSVDSQSKDSDNLDKLCNVDGETLTTMPDTDKATNKNVTDLCTEETNSDTLTSDTANKSCLLVVENVGEEESSSQILNPPAEENNSVSCNQEVNNSGSEHVLVEKGADSIGGVESSAKDFKDLASSELTDKSDDSNVNSETNGIETDAPQAELDHQLSQDLFQSTALSEPAALSEGSPSSRGSCAEKSVLCSSHNSAVSHRNISDNRNQEECELVSSECDTEDEQEVNSGSDHDSPTCDQCMQTDISMSVISCVFKGNGCLGLEMLHPENSSNKISVKCDKEPNDGPVQVPGYSQVVCSTQSQTEELSRAETACQTECLEDLTLQLSFKSQKVEEAENKIQEINMNIYRLLGYLAPGTQIDVDNVDQIIMDMIRTHEATHPRVNTQNNSSST